ncbi:MAG TPA: ATP-dependent DNA ligase [Candidatus Nanoarchaeia archaeon]|nr:ATP-dependent DNA ligase [Candidatus Nanoarchaeia archaeon]
MKYKDLVDVYEQLAGTSKRLEKTQILAAFLPLLKGREELVYLFRGRAFAEYDSREFGISTQLVIKAIARASGSAPEKVVEEFTKRGDLGDVALFLLKRKKQASLSSKELTAEHVLEVLQKLASIEGFGAVDRKLGFIVELLSSASGAESVYLIRTLLGDLRIGVADSIILDSIIQQYFADSSVKEKVYESYAMLNDFAAILKMAVKGARAFEHVVLIPGRPVQVMLAVKAMSLQEGFDVCGKPAAFEHKYDGFRLIISAEGKEVRLFTRRLEDVTKQFPDIVLAVKDHIKATSYILDAEIVGFDPRSGKYMPFEAISQRIKRKYSIEELQKELPVEVNVFDALYVDGESLLDLRFRERRELLGRIVVEERRKIKLATQLVTDSLKEAERFYAEALELGEEGVMVKNLDAPYRPGRYVGYMAKVKPVIADLDLVVVGGEYGTGKRAGGLTSFIVACRSNGEFLEVGRVSSGLKEKSEEGTSYGELDEVLQPLILSSDGNSVRVKPKIVVSVTYQNIQKSPSYSSGYALRFPRITRVRFDRGVKDIASLDEIKKEAKN